MADYPYLDSLNTDNYIYSDEDTETSSSTRTNQSIASAYTFYNYQEDTATTAVYPNAGEQDISGISYCVFGLIGEAGEIANKWKKLFREPTKHANLDGTFEDKFHESIIDELGDVLWYLSQLATELDTELGDIAVANIRKLQDRKQRGVIKGSGDDR